MLLVLQADAQGTLSTLPSALSFQYQLGAASLPTAQNLQVTSLPSGANFTVAIAGSPFNAAWLLVSASSGKAPVTLRVQVNPTGLPAGVYSGTITLTGTVGATPPQQVLPVTLTVGSATPTLAASPTSLNFSYTTGSPIPSPSLTSQFILSSNGAPLSAQISVVGGAWVAVNPTGNISLVGLFSTVSVTIDPTGLVPRVYTGTIRISAPASVNKTVNIPVTLTVNAAVPEIDATWPAGAIQGAGQTIASLLGSGFFANSTVAVSGFTSAATVTVTDSSSATATETISIPVYAAAATHLRITMASPVPTATIGAAYSHTLTVAGGAGPYAWALTSGSLPTGLSVAAGAVSGTPQAGSAGTYFFTLGVTDANGLFAYQPFKLTVDPAASTNLRVVIPSLPSAVVGSAYGPVTLPGAGGTGPYTWTIANEPPGLALSAAGQLNGVPSTVGTTGAIAGSVVSDTAVLATVPASYLIAAGVLRVQVTTPAPGGGTSNEGQLEVYGPSPQILAVLNSANFIQGTTSPGEIITIFGLGLGPATLTLFDPSTPPIPAVLPGGGGTAVTVNGVAAPLLYTSATQAAAIVPYSVSGATAQVAVSYNGLTSQAFTVSLAPTSPGVYTIASSGRGQGAILNYNAATGDYSINSSTNAALRGSTVVIYVTGAGATTSAVSNLLIPVTPAVTPLAPPTVTIGGQGATVLAAQAPPGSVPGLLQINVAVPSSIVAGNALPVVVTIGGVASQGGVTIAVR